MLFDTSSPARRRAVQVTFAFLALLMGGGLVLFGIGGAGGNGGGIVDALGNQQTDQTKQAEKDAKSAQKTLDANPKDEAAARKLARARLVLAAAAFNAQTGALSKDGLTLVNQADSAFTKYLALGPDKPDAGLALQMSTIYASNGVNQYDKAGRAIEAALVTRKATTGLYAQLALYNLAAGDDTKYNEARAKAIELADSKTRKDAVAKQLDEYKKQVDEARKEQAKQAGSDSSGTSTTPALKTLPSLGG